MIEGRLSSIDGAHLTNLDTLRSAVSEIARCSKSEICALQSCAAACLLAHLCTVRLSIFASHPLCHTCLAPCTSLL